jgi:peptidoglycan/LPS O-acetylase OafA/YrhL
MVKAGVLESIQLDGAFSRNPVSGIDGSMWTIKYEFWCYLLVALLGVMGLIRRRALVLVAFIAMLIIYVLHEQLRLDWHTPNRVLLLTSDFNNWPRLLTFFLAGAAFYSFRDFIPWSGVWAAGCFLVILIAARIPPALVGIEPIAGTYALMWLAFAPRGPYGFARNGDLSYGIYLYACPIQQLLFQRYGVGLRPAAMFAVALPMTVIVAVVSWYCVERPFLNRARSAPRVARSVA